MTSIIPSLTLSVGFAWRPVQTFLVSLDINRIRYSELTPPRNVTLGFRVDVNDADLCGLFFDYDGTLAGSPDTLVEKINDGTTVHVGVEKFFTFQSGILRTLAIRGGAFTVNDHDGNAMTDDDETILTVGLGSTWGQYGGDRAFQLDLATSFGDNVTNVILSMQLFRSTL
jgi:hypothetical protein